jgi:hypothetical protein
VNFNVNFNVLLSKYILHPLVKIKKILITSRCMYSYEKKYSVCFFTFCHEVDILYKLHMGCVCKNLCEI